MVRKVTSNSNTDKSTLDVIFVYLIGIFMLIIPFYRGLFFRINYIPAIIIVSALYVVYTVYKLRSKTFNPLDTYMDIAVLLIPIAYLMSFFFAANMKDAFDMFLIYCSYFMLYKLTSDLLEKNEKNKDILINVIIVSTFILSFTAMLNIAGIVELKGVFPGKRLFGLYQYANTTASVLGVGIILTLNKLMSEASVKKVAIYQMILTSLISSFIFTLSRGGYLVLALVLLFNVIFVSARAKLKFMLTLFISFLSSASLIYKYYMLAEEVMSGIWVHYLISIITCAVIIYIIYLLKDKLIIKVSDKVINTALVSLVIILVGIVAFLFSARGPIEYKIEHTASEEQSWKNKNITLYELEPATSYIIEFNIKSSVESKNGYRVLIRSYNSENKRTDIFEHTGLIGLKTEKKNFEFTTPDDSEWIRVHFYNYESDSYTVYKNVIFKDSNNNVVKEMNRLKYIPVAIADRLSDISLETRGASSRINFTKDGLKIIGDYPIIGAGGGAWKNLYRQYQSIPYNTTEVHNFYVQYGTEVGIIGLTALIGLILLMIISMVKSIKAKSSYLYVYLAVMLLLLHSTIDFNLSLVAVGYILWLLIGVINSEKNTPSIGKGKIVYLRVLSLGLVLIVFFMSYSIYYGMKLGTQGARASHSKEDSERVIEFYEKATTFDRYNGAYRIDLAQIMNNQLRKTKEKKYLDRMEEQIFLIRRYEPNNHQYTPVICSLYLSTGKYEEASNMAEERLQNEPMLAQSYALKIDVNYEIASYYVQENKIKEAVPYLEKILTANEEFEKVNAGLKTPLKLEEEYLKKVEAVQRTLDMILADIKQ